MVDLQTALNRKAALQGALDAYAKRQAGAGIAASGSVKTAPSVQGWGSVHAAQSLLDDKTRQTLALTVLGEAGGENLTGQQAVAWVIKNRAESGKFPSDPAKVALQPQQFSTWNKGTGGNNPSKYLGTQQYNKALNIIDSVFGGSVSDPTRGALGYYANSGPNGMEAPNWFNAAATAGTVQIGHHLFAATQPDIQAPIPMPGRPAALQEHLNDAVRVISVRPNGQPVDPFEGTQAYAAAGLPGLTTRHVSLVKVDDTGNPIITAAPQYNQALQAIHDKQDAATATAAQSHSGATLDSIHEQQNQQQTVAQFSLSQALKAGNGQLKTTPTEGFQQFALPRDYHPSLELPTPQAPPAYPAQSSVIPFKYEQRLITVYDKVQVHPDKNVAVLPQTTKVSLSGVRGEDVKGSHTLGGDIPAPEPLIPAVAPPTYKMVPRQISVPVKVPVTVARPVVQTPSINAPVTATPANDNLGNQNYTGTGSVYSEDLAGANRGFGGVNAQLPDSMNNSRWITGY